MLLMGNVLEFSTTIYVLILWLITDFCYIFPATEDDDGTSFFSKDTQEEAALQLVVSQPCQNATRAEEHTRARCGKGINQIRSFVATIASQQDQSRLITFELLSGQRNRRGLA
jgi:hypothetical protein